MTDKPSARVSMQKPSAEQPEQTGATPSARPRYAVYAVVALVVSALACLIASLDLFALKGWILTSDRTANAKLKVKDRSSQQQLHDLVDSTVKSELIRSLLVLVVVGFVAYALWRGRYWSRWAVVGVWLLSTVTGTLAGLTGLFVIGNSAPVAFKLPVFVSAAAFAVAVLLVNMRPTVTYLNASRPARTDRRRGLGALGDLARESEALPGAGPIRGRPSRAEKMATIRQASADKRAGTPAARSTSAASSPAVSTSEGSTSEGSTSEGSTSAARDRARMSKSRRTGS